MAAPVGREATIAMRQCRLLGGGGRFAGGVVFALVRAAPVTPAAFEMAFQRFPLFRAHALPVLATLLPAAMTAAAETAEEDLAQQQNTHGLPIVDLAGTEEEVGYQPVPQEHDHPAERGDTDHNQQRDLETFRLAVRFVT